MNGSQRQNQNDHHKLCTCRQILNNNNTLTTNYLQQNVNLSTVNDNNLYRRADESTSQNTKSNNGMQIKSIQMNQQLPLIDLSVEENITKDGKAIKDKQQATMNRNEHFNMQFEMKTKVDNNGEMAANHINNEEIYEAKDLSMVAAKKKEVHGVPQVKNEAVQDNDSKLDKILKYSAINKAAINRMINNSITQTLEQNSDSNVNVNNTTKNISDNFKAKLMNGEVFNLLRRLQAEAGKPKTDQYTQTDKNNNHKFSQTETQTNNNNRRVDSGVFHEQSNSYVNQNQIKYHMIQDSAQQVIHNNQRVFVQEGMNAGQVMMGREAVGNDEPAMMQAVLPYPYQPPVAYNANRQLQPAVARHPYVYGRYNIRARNPNDRNVHQPNAQPRSQHRPNTQGYTTQNFDWEMANNTNNYQNYQNYHDYQNQFSKF